MKYFISADIEGITGICSFNEASNSSYFKDMMTKEVLTVCNELNKNDATEIVIKDSHGGANNIITKDLPENVKIIRGWPNNPLSMMGGLDNSFDAVLFVGYHSAAYTNGSPMAHTISSATYNKVKINNNIASEFLINSYTSTYIGVPVIFISGDNNICSEAKTVNPSIQTVPVSEGLGNSMTSISPQKTAKLISNSISESLKTPLADYNIELPSEFNIEIEFKEHRRAYRASFYPGVTQINPHTIGFQCTDYMDFLKMFMFI